MWIIGYVVQVCVVVCGDEVVLIEQVVECECYVDFFVVIVGVQVEYCE